MQPEQFIHEVYRRDNNRCGISYESMNWQDMSSSSIVRDAMAFYAPLLPEDKGCPILDIGFGNGLFIAVCIKLGYTNIYGAEFGVDGREYIRQWSPSVSGLDEITSSIGDYLADKPESYQVIHMSHVIEHLSKYSLLYHVDAIYQSLKVDGKIIFRCPNMDSPYANSMLFFTLGHEYGFVESNMKQLLEICQFDDVVFHNYVKTFPTFKERLGRLCRFPFLLFEKVRRRLLKKSPAEYRGSELIVSGYRRTRPAFFKQEGRTKLNH